MFKITKLASHKAAFNRPGALIKINAHAVPATESNDAKCRSI